MANRKKKRASTVKATPPTRPVEVLFDQLAHDFQHPTNRIIQVVALPVLLFAVMGLIWMIPFPRIDFLAKHGYDIFLNWGSFFIAILVYGYLRLAPTLSYGVLLFIGVFSFFIVRLEYIEQNGGPAIWFICAILFVAALGALYSGKNLERQPVSLRSFLRLILIGPIWLLHFAFKKLNIPY